MNDASAVAALIREGYDESKYPAVFLSRYERMECLADTHGVATFVVLDNETGETRLAKCYDKSVNKNVQENDILGRLHHPALPSHIATYENEAMVAVVREYIEGTSLDRYIAEKALTNDGVVKVCVKLCDILIYLHGQNPPIIHRDIKPQNIIVRPDGDIALIDFDISREYRDSAESDTLFIGTRAYAPPEQYGFSQTDCRADIYALGVLIRFLLTGSVRDNANIRYYKPLMSIVAKCTAFAPKDRYANVAAVKSALLLANPKAQFLRKAAFSACALAIVALLAFGGISLYRYVTFDPFTDGHIPAVMDDEARIADAVSYLKEKYRTNLFDDSESYATIGFLKTVLTDVYGYDEQYARALPLEEGPPQESEHNFFPWGMGDEQYVPRMIMGYVAVKIYWVEKVSDYSSLRDDNGYYPGARVAEAFCTEMGIFTGVGRPQDITKGEAALVLANADRVYEATKTA